MKCILKISYVGCMNIKWENRHTEALKKAKFILTPNPVLVTPRHDKDYIIMSDAINRTIASVLVRDVQGIQRNVAYLYRTLLPNERNYSVQEKEALGILASCIKWHQWIYGHKILALTDHRALEYLEYTAQHNSRIAQCKVILSNITIYRRDIVKDRNTSIVIPNHVLKLWINCCLACLIARGK